jgi:hypothetical protein
MIISALADLAAIHRDMEVRYDIPTAFFLVLLVHTKSQEIFVFACYYIVTVQDEGGSARALQSIYLLKCVPFGVQFQARIIRQPPQVVER